MESFHVVSCISNQDINSSLVSSTRSQLWLLVPCYANEERMQRNLDNEVVETSTMAMKL